MNCKVCSINYLILLNKCYQELKDYIIYNNLLCINHNQDKDFYYSFHNEYNNFNSFKLYIITFNHIINKQNLQKFREILISYNMFQNNRPHILNILLYHIIYNFNIYNCKLFCNIQKYNKAQINNYINLDYMDISIHNKKLQMTKFQNNIIYNIYCNFKFRNSYLIIEVFRQFEQ